MENTRLVPDQREAPVSREVQESADPVKLFEQTAQEPGEYPGGYSGRGIVICGGGGRLFTCSYVCIRMLEWLGCDLPIELWHLGPEEMPDEYREVLEPYEVGIVDAREVEQDNPVRILNGWELKPFSIIHSEFKEVLFLDADNVPVRDPSFLFDTEEYRRFGAVFWPDFGRLDQTRRI